MPRVNMESKQVQYDANTGVWTEIVERFNGRDYLLISNHSHNDVWLNFNDTPAEEDSISLNAGTSIEFAAVGVKDPIWARSKTGLTGNLEILEEE